MDDSVKKACFEEISHLICDLDKKVSVSHVSNNWNLSFDESEKVLVEWLNLNKNQDFMREFLVRGVLENGHGLITVIPENNLNSVEKKCSKFSKSLYSIETPSKSNRLEIVDFQNCHVISLILNNGSREDIIRPMLQPQSAITKPKESTTEKPKSNLFGNVAVKKPIESKSNEINTFKKPASESNVTEENLNVKSPTEGKPTIKKEIKSPIKKTPVKKDVNSKVVPSQRSTISSFFSKTPATKTIKTEPISSLNKNNEGTNTKIEKEITKPIESNCKATENGLSVGESNEKSNGDQKQSSSRQKRSFTDICDSDSDEDVIPPTPQEKPSKSYQSKKKKPKTNPTKSTEKKRSRILNTNESSDEEMETLQSSPNSEKEIEKTVSGETKEKRPIKAKRTVNRVYEDEEGYIHTVREVEEYICSEEEEDKPKENIAGNDVQTEPVSIVKPPEKIEKKVSPKKGKKKTPPKTAAAGTKQGSILSFFGKK